MVSRAETVNGIKVGRRPLCPDGKHKFAAYHGYCLDCGEDGWDAKTRKEIQSAQGQVRYG